jgi:peroxiredoxin
LRQDTDKFVEHGAEIIALGPDNQKAFVRHWETEQLPYIGLADRHSAVADKYYQEVNIFKLGRMPAQFIVDKEGTIRYFHYGDSMSDIPQNQELLNVLDDINSFSSTSE